MQRRGTPNGRARSTSLKLDAPVMTKFTSNFVPIPESSSCETLHTMWRWRDIWGAEFLSSIDQCLGYSCLSAASLLHCFCLIKVEYSCDDWNWPPISFQFLKAARCCSLCGDEETSEEPSLSFLIDIFVETFVCQFPSNFFFHFKLFMHVKFGLFWNNAQTGLKHCCLFAQ